MVTASVFKVLPLKTWLCSIYNTRNSVPYPLGGYMQKFLRLKKLVFLVFCSVVDLLKRRKEPRKEPKTPKKPRKTGLVARSLPQAAMVYGGTLYHSHPSQNRDFAEISDSRLANPLPESRFRRNLRFPTRVADLSESQISQISPNRRSLRVGDLSES
jgi:hypothetical protein